MNETQDQQLSEQEARRLRELGQVPSPPPPEMKARILQDLTGLGLVAASRRSQPQWIPWAAAAALAVIGFGLGRETAGRAPTAGRTGAAEAGQRYVLLLNGGGSTTPEENAARRKEYGDWLNDLSRRGMGVDGQELVGERHDLPEERGGPPVVGYFVITARNESEALEVAKTTPHLRHGGGVTVSAIR